MTDEQDFFFHALAQIKQAVGDLIGRANLHVRETPLPRWLARQTSGQLRALETMLRRVLLLMALALLRRDGPPCAAKVEQVPTNRQSAPRHSLQRSFHMSPRPLGADSIGAFPGRGTGSHSAVHLRRLFRRIIAAQRVLENPKAYAARLAGYMGRMMAAGETAPIILPKPPPRRARAELALVAQALPIQLRAALTLWQDSS